jgi:serpin B
MSTADFSAVDLPYGDSAFTMTVILPNTGRNIDSLATSLQSATWNTWTNAFKQVNVALWLPKLTLQWSRSLNGDLNTMGMHDAFVPGVADFTRMSTNQGHSLYIDSVKQKTYVDINEDGTEAAAVTSVGSSATAAPFFQDVRVDRPFIFAIRERLSGTIIFMGKIVRMP